MNTTKRGTVRRRRYEGWLRTALVWPVVLGLAAVATFGWALYLVRQHADPHQRDARQLVFAALKLLRGSYVPLREQEAIPPADIALCGLAATFLTVLAAGSLLLLSRRVADFFRILFRPARLVVIGDGKTAAALIKSCIDDDIAVILVTDTRESAAARETTTSIPIIALGQLHSAVSSPLTRRAIKGSRHVAVATDTDSLNMQLYDEVCAIRQARGPRRAGQNEAGTRDADTTPLVLVVIHDANYAELLRPVEIRRRLPGNEVTCPAENIAEHVCHLIVAAATGPHKADGIAVEIHHVPADGTSGDQPEPGETTTIRNWVQRLEWSLNFVHGAEYEESGRRRVRPVPNIRVITGNQPIGDGELLVEVFTGPSSSSVALEVMSHQNKDALRIAVANKHMMTGAQRFRHRQSPGKVATGSAWLDEGAEIPIVDGRFVPPLLVVDPEDVGLDAALVTDDVGTQWARTFDVTYALMYSDGRNSVTGWRPGAPMGNSTRRLERDRIAAEKSQPPNGTPWKERKSAAARKARKEIGDRYSSRQAVEHMLRVLDDCGYELRRFDVENQGETPEKPDLEVEYVAEREHHDWLKRTWPDTSRSTRRFRPRIETVSDYSTHCRGNYCYQGLVVLENAPDTPDGLRFAANYNRRIATETYPAIAASFGYRIWRYEDCRHPPLTAECHNAACPCPKTTSEADGRAGESVVSAVADERQRPADAADGHPVTARSAQSEPT